LARRKKRQLDGHYESDDVVSVWLGTFPDALASERYFQEDWQNRDADDFPTCVFWKDLGIQWFDHDSQEGGFIGPAVPVAELLDRGWSYVDTFREPVLLACQERGIVLANTVMFLYDYDYPEEAGYSSPHLRFVGVFPYSKQDD
jgi:hypothetical protein